MADFNSSRAGQINLAGDPKATFLKVWSGEVLTAFAKNTVALERTMSQTIASGKTASFPSSWRATASYHTPGTQITGQTIAMGEMTIDVDDLLISPVFIPNIDEAMSHFEYRSIYSFECGKALAYTMDSNILQSGVLAARAAAQITGANGGSSLINANYKTDNTALASGLFSAAEQLDNKSVPEDSRYCYVRPSQYYLLAQNTTAINSFFGGQGAYADGTIVRIAGIELVKSLHLPITNIASGLAKYQVNASTTAALIMHKGAVGTVKLVDVATEQQYLIEYQGTLVVSKVAVGHGILRPECAVELKTA